MSIVSIWRRLTARRPRRRSFYETQVVMKRALDEQAVKRAASAEPTPPPDPTGKTPG